MAGRELLVAARTDALGSALELRTVNVATTVHPGLCAAGVRASPLSGIQPMFAVAGR